MTLLFKNYNCGFHAQSYVEYYLKERRKSKVLERTQHECFEALCKLEYNLITKFGATH